MSRQSANVRVWVLAIALANSAMAAHADELSGCVQKREQHRLARPSAAQQSDAGQKALNSALTDDNFKIEQSGATAQPQIDRAALDLSATDAPAQTKGDDPTTARSAEIPKIETPVTGPVVGTGVNSDTQKILPEPKQIILVRLVYHRLDEKNAFYAICMINCLRQAGPNVEVTLMLDKEATTLANRNIGTQFITRGESHAQRIVEAIQALIGSGGRVIASKEWANDYSINGGNAIDGIQFLTMDEFAKEILKSSKILEY